MLINHTLFSLLHIFEVNKLTLWITRGSYIASPPQKKKKSYEETAPHTAMKFCTELEGRGKHFRVTNDVQEINFKPFCFLFPKDESK